MAKLFSCSTEEASGRLSKCHRKRLTSERLSWTSCTGKGNGLATRYNDGKKKGSEDGCQLRVKIESCALHHGTMMLDTLLDVVLILAKRAWVRMRGDGERRCRGTTRG